MAKSDEQTDEQQKDADKGFVFFRSQIAGLSVLTGYTEGTHVAPTTVRFEPVEHPDEFGNVTRDGYLRTNDKAVIEKCRADYNVIEIEPDEYNNVMKLVNDPNKPNVKRSRL